MHEILQKKKTQKHMSFAFPSDFSQIYPKKIKLTSFSVLVKIFTQTKKEEKTQTETYIEKCLLFWHKHWK